MLSSLSTGTRGQRDKVFNLVFSAIFDALIFKYLQVHLSNKTFKI